MVAWRCLAALWALLLGATVLGPKGCVAHVLDALQSSSILTLTSNVSTAVGSPPTIQLDGHDSEISGQGFSWLYQNSSAVTVSNGVLRISNLTFVPQSSDPTTVGAGPVTAGQNGTIQLVHVKHQLLSCTSLSNIRDELCGGVSWDVQGVEVRTDSIYVAQLASQQLTMQHVLYTCTGGSQPAGAVNMTCAGAIVSTGEQLKTQIEQLQLSHDNVTISIPSGTTISLAGTGDHVITKQVRIRGAQLHLGTSWLDFAAGNGSIHIQPPGLLELYYISYRNLPLGPDCKFLPSSFVGYFWSIYFPREINQVYLRLNNVWMTLPDDLYSFLVVWWTRLLSPAPGIAASAAWLNAIPGLSNATMQTFEASLPGNGLDVFLNTIRHSAGQLWLNVSLAQPHTFNTTLMPGVAHTGVLDVAAYGPEKYVAPSNINTTVTADQLVSAMAYASPTTYYMITASNISFSNASQPAVATMSQNQARKLLQTDTLPDGTVIFLQGHPLRTLSVDFNSQPCALWVKQGGNLVVRNLTIYNSGVALDGSVDSGSPYAAQRAFTSALWSICGVSNGVDLYLDNVTIVVPPEELNLLKAVVQGQSCNCQASNQQLDALLTWAGVSKVTVVNSHTLYANSWLGWRWSGSRITITSDSTVGAFTAAPIASGIAFALPGSPSKHSHSGRIAAWAVPVAVVVASVAVVVAIFLIRTRRGRSKAALPDTITVCKGNNALEDTSQHSVITKTNNSMYSSLDGTGSTDAETRVVQNNDTIKLHRIDDCEAVVINRAPVSIAGNRSFTRQTGSSSFTHRASSQPPSAVTDGVPAVVLESPATKGRRQVGDYENPRGESSCGSPSRLAMCAADVMQQLEASGRGPGSGYNTGGAGSRDNSSSQVRGVPLEMIMLSSSNSRFHSQSRSSEGTSFSDSFGLASDSFDKPGTEYGDYSLVEHQEVDKMLEDIRGEMAEQSRLVIYDVLGMGAHGVVYKGEWRGRPVAVKTLLFQAQLLHGRQQALREVAVNSRVCHPNCVNTYTFELKPISQAHDTGVSDKGQQGMTIEHGAAGDFKLYIVQEFCDAGHLKKAVDTGLFQGDHGEPDLLAVTQIALDLACGLQHVHFKNVIHGDLSPANVLLKTDLTRPGRLKVVAKVGDFGLSRCLQDGEQSHVSGVRQGTPFYTAPEVAVHGQLTRAADVFSFGVILHELYCGQPAWRRKFKVKSKYGRNNSVLVKPASPSLTAHHDLNISPSINPDAHPSSLTATSGPQAVALKESHICISVSGMNDDVSRGSSSVNPSPQATHVQDWSGVRHDSFLDSSNVVTLSGSQQGTASTTSNAMQARLSLPSPSDSNRLSALSNPPLQQRDSDIRDVPSSTNNAEQPFAADSTINTGDMNLLFEQQQAQAVVTAVNRFMNHPVGICPLPPLPPSCPDWYQALVASCLQSDPTLRPRLPAVVSILMAKQQELLQALSSSQLNVMNEQAC